MKALIYSHEVFYKHVGCYNAELFEEASNYVDWIGKMLIDKIKRREFYVKRPESHEFMEFIDGNGFKVTRLTDYSYIVEVI